MKHLKKALSLLLVFAMLFSISACTKKPTEEEMIQKAKELIPKAQVLDVLFSVDGIPTASASNGNYLKADLQALAQYGFSSYKDIKAYAASIYTDTMLRQFESLFVKAYLDGSTVQKIAYCYDETNEDGSFKALWVSKDGVHRKTDTVGYRLDTLKAEKIMRDAVTLSLSAVVTNEDGKTQTHEKNIRLVRVGEEWKLDSTTVITYFEK